MRHENQVLVIDAGNTVIKLALFQDEKLLNIQRVDVKQFDEFMQENSVRKTIISSVLSPEETTKISANFDSPIIVTCDTPLPINLNYKSKETLGIDRICNSVFASKQINQGFAVTIDIGTCVKFDLVSADGEYLGGSISPGIGLRYKSLNDYTGNLPLLDDKSNTELVGTDTNSSIRSGVINGIKAEIHHLMELYSNKFDDLTFFVTGGDARYFDIHSKNDIFAIENLTLYGLYEIYVFNA